MIKGNITIAKRTCRGGCGYYEYVQDDANNPSTSDWFLFPECNKCYKERLKKENLTGDCFIDGQPESFVKTYVTISKALGIDLEKVYNKKLI